jgi:heat shock protein HslJ
MHFSTVAAAALLTLAASMPAEANAQGAPYKALGTEPFWSLSIDSRNMRLESPDRAPVTVPTPKVIHGFAGEIYQTRRMNVNVVHKSCSDGMSDRTYPDTVTVTLDGRTLQGCGGAPSTAPAPVPGAPILGDWRVQSIAGRPVARGSHVTASFSGGRISGNTGCNRYNGTYRFERGRLTSGPLATTRRACVQQYANNQERTLLNLLGQRLTVSSTRNGRLVLTARNGRTLVLARERGRR